MVGPDTPGLTHRSPRRLLLERILPGATLRQALPQAISRRAPLAAKADISPPRVLQGPATPLDIHPEDIRMVSPAAKVIIGNGRAFYRNCRR